jgi:serine/threonine-protein kinase HipA
MGRRRSHPPLKVLMNNRALGHLTKESNGVTTFAYDTEWLSWSNAMPVSLSLPLRRQTYSGAPVLAVFENMLPDVDAVRRGIATRVGAEGIDAYSLLSKIGGDCVGALQFVLHDENIPNVGSINGIELDEEDIETLLTTLSQSHLGIRGDDGFRISIAGAQEKTALLRHNGGWYKPTGTTPTTHIFKPQIGLVSTSDGTIDLRDSVENEYYCLQLLSEFGLKVPDVSIETFGATKVLVVKRFDRILTKDLRLIRLPQEDLCQALSVPPTQKYQNHGGPSAAQIFRLLRASKNRTSDQIAFFRSQILFWLIGATDGHGKNFSLHLQPRNEFNLAPFYDVLTAQPYVDAAQIRHKDFKLAMSVGTSRHYDINGIVGRHFLEMAKEADLSPSAARAVIEELIENSELALSRVEAMAPADFPIAIHLSVKAGFRARLKKLAILV